LKITVWLITLGCAVVARLPAGLRYAGVAALSGLIYVAGGVTPSGESDAVLAIAQYGSTRSLNAGAAAAIAMHAWIRTHADPPPV